LQAERIPYFTLYHGDGVTMSAAPVAAAAMIPVRVPAQHWCRAERAAGRAVETVKPMLHLLNVQRTQCNGFIRRQTDLSHGLETALAALPR